MDKMAKIEAGNQFLDAFYSLPNPEDVTGIKMKNSFVQKVLLSDLDPPYRFRHLPIYLDDSIEGDFEFIFEEKAR